MKAKQKLCLLLCVLTAGLSACGGTSKPAVSKADQPFVVRDRQTKNFGNDQYDGTQKEIQQAFKEKYQLTFPPTMEAFDQEIRQVFSTLAFDPSQSSFNIYTNETNLTLQDRLMFQNKESQKLQGSGLIEAQYQYRPKEKQTRISTYKVQIQGIPLSTEQASTFLQQASRILGLKEMGPFIEKMKKEAADPEKCRNKQQVIYDNLAEAKQQKQVGKNIIVKFSGEGTIAGVYVTVMDQL